MHTNFNHGLYYTREGAPVVLQLLQGEDVLVEVLLKFFVGVVDVKLLKAIHLEAKTDSQNQIVPPVLIKHLPEKQAPTSKFSKPKMSRMPMDLKFSFPFIFWLILRMIQEKHWEYNAMATESLESTACKDEMERRVSSRLGGVRDQSGGGEMWTPHLLYGERGADLLSSQDYRALSQDLGQLEGIQAQQLAGVSDG